MATAASQAEAACSLKSAGGKIKHVIYLNFDNVHFARDNPNVPSDVEQMPNLLKFILANGTLSNNHWTPLISHTADDLLTAMTGVYGDRMGMPVANSFGISRPDGSVSIGNPSFLYWTATTGDGTPLMINEKGNTAPAPWVPYTRAGCDVGAFSVANIEFERLPDDVRTVFGVGSPQDKAVTAALSLPNTPPNQPARQAPNTDYLGVAIHCAQNSALCSGPGGRPDLLPQEPGTYSGFNALFGNVNVAPVICKAAPNGCSNGSVKAIDGTVIADAYGRPGFPNVFSPTADQSLGYAATMLEAGVPVVYVYVADAHDRNPLPLDPITNQPTPNHAFGPGEAEYVAQLKAYDTAFGKFFARLAADGITKDNTLFVTVTDENDHFVGAQPTPLGCDGVKIACTYSLVGEVDAALNRLLLTERNNATPFLVHSDSAPTVYITGNPAPTASLTRTLETDANLLMAVNPYTGGTEKLSAFLADQAEMKLLHMVTADPARTPSFTMFGDPNFFFFTSTPNTNCSQPPSCVAAAPAFAWNHGDVQKDITRTWFSMVGPGVRALGLNNEVFSDHTDIRPTMLALLGLKDTYVHDGRVLVEKLEDFVLPGEPRRSRQNFIDLAHVYKELNATLGSVGRNSLTFANRSITGDAATYNAYLKTIADLTEDRDELAGKIKSALDAAAFGNAPIDDREEDDFIRHARRIIEKFERLAEGRRDDLDD
ncbi:MAG: hypothetical protein JO163_20130 [Methylobacteriaceae bacterium]|nr:hypothetical protein [Methylobacteriaceae bacterium]